ncbi:hypothetical protein T07_2469 [Trichinella nelsoni]|uniref:Uncharacterized protein n=1 Tax=Trichinella nelsoni TaxID=6336 RepID=A0A0V0SJF4_9BILA|nr:hypothetical protein T07_2469 [Trichinella nelsoni]
MHKNRFPALRYAKTITIKRSISLVKLMKQRKIENADDTKQITDGTKQNMTREKALRRHVLNTYPSHVKRFYTATCAISDFYANRGGLKIAFIFAPAIDVRRMNNGVFNAMTDEE